MIKKLSYLTLFLLLGCAPQKKQMESAESKLSYEIDVVIDNLKKNEGLSFIVQNKSKGQVYIHSHRQTHIERLVGNSWIKLRIQDCPCGAPCARPAEFIEIAKEGSFTLTWDRTESWCGEKNSYGIPETIKLSVPSGFYRIMVVFSVDQKNTQVFYKEFNV